MKALRQIGVLAIVVLVLCARVAAESRFYYSRPLMGTRFQIVLYAENAKLAQGAADKAFELAEKIEQACSDYRAESELNQLLERGGSEAVSPLLAEVLDKALEIAKRTDGAYDPTVGWHSKNWRRARAERELPSADALEFAKAHTGWRLLERVGDRAVVLKDKQLRVDLGGIAKGFAADKMLEQLKAMDVPRAMVVAGGDVRLGEAPPQRAGWKVGIKTQSGEVQEFVELAECAVSTSGDLYQVVEIAGVRYAHIVDSQTGLGLTRAVSATVVAPTATESDALATACCVRENFAKTLGSAMLGAQVWYRAGPESWSSKGFPVVQRVR